MEMALRGQIQPHMGQYLKDVRTEGGRGVRESADFADEQF